MNKRKGKVIAMKKSELISAAAASCGKSKKDVSIVLNAVLDTISSSLQKGEPVQLMGFGTFEVKKTQDKVGNHPQLHTPIQIPGYKKVCFRISKTLKNLIAAN